MKEKQPPLLPGGGSPSGRKTCKTERNNHPVQHAKEPGGESSRVLLGGAWDGFKGEAIFELDLQK